MINDQFFEKPFKSDFDFRFLLFLSRNNAWVTVGDDVYKVTIKDIVKSANKVVNNQSMWVNDFVHLSSSQENDLKLKLSNTLISASELEGGSATADIDASHSKVVADMSLKIKSYDYNRLSMLYWNEIKGGTLEGEVVVIHLTAENFDSLYAKEISNDSSLASIISNYSSLKQNAVKDAQCSAIWLAAAAGDSEILNYLISESSDIDINSTYQGKSILQAMNEADPLQDTPFNYIQYPKNLSDYAKTLEILIEHGLSEKSMKSFYDNRNSSNGEVKLFAKYQSDRNGLYGLLSSRFAQTTNLNIDQKEMSAFTLTK